MAKILIIVLGSGLIAAAAFVAVAIVIAARAGSRGGGKHDHYGTTGGPAANTSAHGPSHAKPAPRERIDQRQSPASELL